MPTNPSNCRRIVPALTNGSVLHAGTFDLASKAKLLTANLPHNPPDLNPEIHGSASAAPLVSRSPPRPFFDLLSQFAIAHATFSCHLGSLVSSPVALLVSRRSIRLSLEQTTSISHLIAFACSVQPEPPGPLPPRLSFEVRTASCTAALSIE